MNPHTSRRAVMLGGAGSLALAVPSGVCAPMARSPDAALVALGREHPQIEQEQTEIEAATDRLRAAGGNVRPLIDRSDAITERVCDITQAAVALQAHTPDGIRAKVTILGDSWSFALLVWTRSATASTSSRDRSCGTWRNWRHERQAC